MIKQLARVGRQKCPSKTCREQIESLAVDLPQSNHAGRLFRIDQISQSE
jgi:hypothetical protein